MTFLQIAEACIARGWYVFPCVPGDKKPLTAHGFHDATNDPEIIRQWANQWPNANCGIACEASNLAVLDADHGLSTGEDFEAWRLKMGLPESYAVRTGRRPEFGVQVYFSGTMKGCNWTLEGCSGQIKSLGGYVMASGSVHPSGAAYTDLFDFPLAPLPDMLMGLATPTEKRERVPQHQFEEGERRDELVREAGRVLRVTAMSKAVLAAHLFEFNDEWCNPPLSGEEVEEVAYKCNWEPEPEPVALVLGKPKVSDWREHFHTKDEALNAPPVTFLIKDFLQREGVTAIAAPVRERKSLIALNVVHALLTGEKLFDHFEVVTKPERVLYLCPEVSLGPFTDRVRKIGLIEYVGEKFFYRTMSSEGHLTLNDETLRDALPGSVVVLDTAIRFLEGDENSSAHIRAFADSIFALLRNGAASVLLLHHSPKDMGDHMTLESALRGSGDLGAFLASCWGTRLQEPENPYQSASFLSNLKQRDFESEDFEVTCGTDCRMHMVTDKLTVTLSQRKNRKNKDGLEDAAIAILRDNPKMSLRETARALKDAGITRGKDWVKEKRYELMQVSDATGISSPALP